jgi:hypothetical protein
MKLKNFIIYLLYYLGILHICFFINIFFGKILCVNYHCTPFDEKENFENQIKFFHKYFKNCNYEKLTKLFYKSDGFLLFKRPYLILTFDDGLRSNFENALPILEKYNMTGWFFICPNFVDESDITTLNSNSIFPRQLYLDDRYCMNTTELNFIKKNHIIGSHTFSHYRFNKSDDLDKLNFEIQTSQLKLSKIIKNDINVFAWVGGEEIHYTKEANNVIISTYKIVFNTLVKMINFRINLSAIPRTNIESNYSKQLFLFQISGLLDIYYFPKRFRTLNKIKK